MSGSRPPKPAVTSAPKVVAALTSRSADDVVWARVGKLFDGVSDRVIQDAHLVYDALKIRYIGSADKPPSVELLADQVDSPTIVLAEYTALPGLVDAHAHLFLEGQSVDMEVRRAYLKNSSSQLLERARLRWPAILRAGITAVRDAGDKNGVGLTLAAECQRRGGHISDTPYIDSPGAAIHHQGRYGSFMGRPLEEFASTADCVADRVAAGADRIKIIPTGIINFRAGRVTSQPQMTAAEVLSLARSARAHGLQTFAHASGCDGIENAINGEVDSVEHGYFMTQSQLSQLRDRGTGWVPTIAPVYVQIERCEELGWDRTVVDHLQRIVDGHFETLCQAADQGVCIIAGSDAGSCGVPHGLGLLRELELMQQAGMSSLAVLRSATGNATERLEFREPIGKLLPGYRSRVILTPHDVTSDIRRLSRDKFILFDGQVVASDGSISREGL